MKSAITVLVIVALAATMAYGAMVPALQVIGQINSALESARQ